MSRVEQSSRDVETRNNRAKRLDKLTKATAGIALAAVTAGCAPSGAFSSAENKGRYAVTAVTIEGGTIDEGVNVRGYPAVDEDSGMGNTNACGVTSETFQIPEMRGLYAAKSDANGDWIGINSHTPGIPEECADDSDGMVWINSAYYDGKVKTPNPAVTMLIPRD